MAITKILHNPGLREKNRYFKLVQAGVTRLQLETGIDDPGVIHLFRHSLKPHQEIDRILCESGWGPDRFKKAINQYYADRYGQASQPNDEITERIRYFRTLCTKRKERLARVTHFNQQLTD